MKRIYLKGDGIGCGSIEFRSDVISSGTEVEFTRTNRRLKTYSKFRGTATSVSY